MIVLERPKVGLYIDGANMFYQGKRSGWFLDYKKLLDWLSQENEIAIAKYFIGEPTWEPAKSIAISLNGKLSSCGYKIISKKMKQFVANGHLDNKCNFDVEIHDEIIHDLDSLNAVYLVSGDSDFIRTKERVISNKKKIIFLSYRIGCAWEIRKFKHILLDNYRTSLEKVIHN